MAVNQLPKLSELPEPPDRLVGDQERFDVLTFNSLKAQKKMVNEDLNKTLIPKLNEFAVDVNASVNAAAQSERNAAASATTAGNKANEAAACAATAGTKAGEASKSAAEAKTSETNAAASKTAAAKSATDAATAQRGAEAARDEAQNLANVGYASKAKAGLAKVDGKTTLADAGGMITVKDMAIGGDAADLASKRGQIGNVFVITDANADGIIESGNYLLNGAVSGTPNNTPCFLEVLSTGISNLAQICHQISGQRFTYARTSPDGGASWNGWDALISTRALGDGITVNSGIISVPEYQGATPSAPGTSGLVPPAAAGEHDLFMTGGGNYKAALTKITDSVASSASDTAASAKAVKLAYDRGSAGITAAENALNTANAKLPLSGGTVTGSVGITGVLTVSPPAGSAEGGEIRLTNGADGNYPAVIDATANKIRFFGKPGVDPVEVNLETGRFVGNLTGKADSAVSADNALAFANGRRWVEVVHTGNPGWLMGSVNDKLRPVDARSLSVNYADRAGHAEEMDNCFSYSWKGNPGVVNVPSGGTWFVFVGNMTAGVEIGGLYPGGSQISTAGWGSPRVFAFGIKWKN